MFVGGPGAGTAVSAPLDEVGEDEVVGGGVVEGVADELAVPFGTVDVGEAGEEGEDVDLAGFDGERVGSLRQRVAAAVEGPVGQEVGEEAWLATVAHFGVGAAAGTDDGGVVEGAGKLAAGLVEAEPLVGVELDEALRGGDWCGTRGWIR